MKFLNGKNVYIKTSFINLIVILIFAVLTVPFFFFSLMEIPLGVLLGGLFGSLSYLIFGLLEKKKIQLTVVVIIVKFVLLAALAVGDAFLYFKVDIKIFNLFALLGSYLVSLIIFIIISRKGVENERISGK